MSYLQRYKIIFLFLLTPLFSQAQYVKGGLNNYRNKQYKPYYFGMSFGIHSSTLNLKHAKTFINSEEIMSIESVVSPGFNVNVISNLKLGENFDIRVLPGFAWSTHELDFKLVNQEADLPTIESVYFELPLHFRYKSEPYKDMRLFYLLGGKYAFDIASKSRTESIVNKLKISTADFSIEAGFGGQFFFPYFILSPQLKYSYGISNMIFNNVSGSKVAAIDRAWSHCISFSLQFEG